MRARLAVLLLLLAGCPPEFTQPLSPAAGQKVDDALLGNLVEAISHGLIYNF